MKKLLLVAVCLIAIGYYFFWGQKSKTVIPVSFKGTWALTTDTGNEILTDSVEVVVDGERFRTNTISSNIEITNVYDGQELHSRRRFTYSTSIPPVVESKKPSQMLIDDLRFWAQPIPKNAVPKFGGNVVGRAVDMFEIEKNYGHVVEKSVVWIDKETKVTLKQTMGEGMRKATRECQSISFIPVAPSDFSKPQ